MTFELESPAFHHNDSIPMRYTGDGAEVSPPLAWHGVPAEAQSLALIVEDPDAPDPAAPRQAFVHWLVYNLPGGEGELPEGVTAAALPQGAAEGINDAHGVGYAAPLPAIGRHRYFFRLYALAAPLAVEDTPLNRASLERAMSGLVLAQTELVGLYQRPE
ncbi:YbhB/YbcL family Raf kinase inhibitor-like protein [Arhodomonas sp. AD133]|uniref:YbhB/YbcL family Raf kinase inhibitor-like protein n=1 Tax=Arhodomonas sp. AD133 TaxID=3415009 RepID=UPI003EBAE9B2